MSPEHVHTGASREVRRPGVVGEVAVSEVQDLPAGRRTGAGMRGTSEANFLLVGCVRSGTTMLRLMLDDHPAVSCMQESDFIATHYRACAAGGAACYARALEQDWLWGASGLVFPNEAESYAAAVRDFFNQRRRTSGCATVGATVMSGFEHLPDVVSRAKYVHLLRDGRPVAASIQAMGWAGNAYAAARRWRSTLMEITALRRRIPADHWLDVRYEELVKDPAGQLARICAFLGVQFDSAMLSYPAHTTYASPDAQNADRWRTRISPRDIYFVEMAAGDVLEESGYIRMFPPATPGILEQLVLWSDHRYRRTLYRVERYGGYLMTARWAWRRVGVRRAQLETRFDAITQAHIK